MRNLSVIDRKSNKCSLFTSCTAAAIERNILYFANHNELCKLEVEKANAEENVSLSLLATLHNQPSNVMLLYFIAGGSFSAFK